MSNQVLLAHLMMTRTFKWVSFSLQHLLPYILDKLSLQVCIVLTIPEPCKSHVLSRWLSSGHGPDHSLDREGTATPQTTFWLRSWTLSHSTAVLLPGPLLSSYHTGAVIMENERERACFCHLEGLNDTVSMVISCYIFCMKYVVFSLIDTSEGHSNH